ncbi:DUF2335 domain-containing protein [Acinetobacter radioresistens]|uniref:DUF2335 domain-containing protein n=1 Tax=Acinetobacter radioresistens TaxID=40216 RepID=UPI000C33A154|nr:DUF2335 domain-containing protein [Acinetobacter radioresistens]PKD80251.1 DUF2335 domain-containing protein [Acinetobacter radioresistens]
MSQHNRTKRGVATKNGNEVSVALEEAESYSPYPPPELVKAFEEIQEGLASRLMQIVENEQKISHEVARHQMVENSRINTANIENQKNNSTLFFLGLLFGVLIGLGILGVAVYALYRGYPWVATAAFSALGVILMILVLRKMPSTSDQGPKSSQSK